MVRQSRPRHKKRLQFSAADFLLDEDHGVDSSDYPNFIHRHDQRLTLTYEFDPASARDGITVTVPLASLNAFSDTDFDYLVPAMLGDKIELFDSPTKPSGRFYKVIL